MSKFYICKTRMMALGAACLKVVNDKGEELSVAFGCSKMLWFLPPAWTKENGNDAVQTACRNRTALRARPRSPKRRGL